MMIPKIHISSMLLIEMPSQIARTKMKGKKVLSVMTVL